MSAEIDGRVLLPRISCLMVTRERLEMAARSISWFGRQTYPNRELIVISDGVGDIPALERLAEATERPFTVRGVTKGSCTLGALRNKSLDLASGDYFCQWDDDDLYHPERLALQFAAMRAKGAAASFLTDQLQLVTSTASLYWCDWSRPRRQPWDLAIPNTILCSRHVCCRYCVSGPNASLGEDSDFAAQLRQAYVTAHIGGLGLTHVYVSHGANTWTDAHHTNLVRITAVGRAELIAARDPIVAALGDYAIGSVTVRDFLDLPAFTFRPAVRGLCLSTDDVGLASSAATESFRQP